MNKQVLVQLIDQLEHFESTLPGGEPYTMEEFLGFLNTQAIPLQEMRMLGGEKEYFVQKVREESDSDVGILITLMFRYAKSYIKKALQKGTIQTADEFSFLITLMTFGNLTKTELINKQVMEKTSGIEVIKRLLGLGMIREYADETDKRSVRVEITEKGRQEVISLLPEMAKVSRIVVGNLTPTEIKTLSYLLKKLDLYHNDIFMNKRSASLEEILGQEEVNR